MMYLSSFKSKNNFAFIIATVLLLNFHSRSDAKVTLNALCYANHEKSSEFLDFSGSDKREEKFELASISKLVTSHWAISIFGANHRFETKIYIHHRHGNRADVHIAGAMDPMFGREMYYFLTSELNKIGITEIENLTFDEKFKINWKILDLEDGVASYRSIIYHPHFIEKTLKSILSEPFDTARYAQLRSKVKNLANVEMLAKANIKYGTIKYLNSKDFSTNSLDNEWQLYKLKSIPLYKIVKQMNLVSHNLIADGLWLAASQIDLSERGNIFEDPNVKIDWDDVNAKYTFRLKESASHVFTKFIQQKLGLTQANIEFINGSGDSEYGAKSKIYNKASCTSMVKIINDLKNILLETKLDLPHVVAVAGSDKSTLGSRYSAFINSLVAKTGSVNPAITLAGELTTKSGAVIFTVLQHTEGDDDWSHARDMIRQEVHKLFGIFKNMKPVNYAPMSITAMDQNSELELVERR